MGAVGEAEARAVDDVDFDVKRGEVFGLLVELNADADTAGNVVARPKASTAARARIPLTEPSRQADLLARAIARVDVVCCSEPGQRLRIGNLVVALTANRAEPLVWDKTQPRQIVKDGGLEFRTAADSIMIFNAQQHAVTVLTRQSPHVDGVDDMPQVQVAGGRGSEAGNHR